MPTMISAELPTTPEELRLAQAIDHTKLTFAEGEDETAAIETLCREARENGFYAVCVRPRHVALSKKLLVGSKVKVATVIGFPARKVTLADELKNPTVGNFTLAQKEAETRQAIEDRVDELDLVIDVALLKQDMQEKSNQTKRALQVIGQAAGTVPVKVIIETDLLTPEEIVQVTRWCAETGMAMVKTSTGMVEGGQGATLEGVRLIRDTLAEMQAPVSIKASGGIKNREQALAFLDEGVSRLGTSSGVALMRHNPVTDPGAY